MRSEAYQRLIYLTRGGDADAARRLLAEATRRADLPHRMLALLACGDVDALCDLFDATPDGPRLDAMLDAALSAQPDLDLCAYAWQEALLDGEDNPRVRLASALVINRHTLRRAHLQRLAASPLLDRVRSLTLAKVTRAEGLDALAGSALSRHLQSLTIQQAPLTAADLAALCRAPWPRLERLCVTEAQLTPDALRLLAGHAQHFPALRALTVSRCRIGNASALALAGSALLAQLGSLDLSGNDLCGALPALLASPHLPAGGGFSLDVSDNPLSLDDLSALLRSWATPEHLNLSLPHLRADALRAKLPSLPFTRVRALSLSKTSLDADTLCALLSAPDARRVVTFSAAQCSLPSPLPDLADLLPALDTLSLHDCDVTALAAPPPASLRRLRLRASRLCDADAAALLGAPWLGQLSELTLSDNPLTAAALAPLQHLPAPSDGEPAPLPALLDLRFCPIGDQGAVLVALCPALAQTRLFCWNCDVSVWGARLLRLSPFIANAAALDLGAAPLKPPPSDRHRQALRLLCALQRASQLSLSAPIDAPLTHDLAHALLQLSLSANPGRALSNWLLDRPEVEDLFGDDEALTDAIRDARRDPAPLGPDEHPDAILCQAAAALLSLRRSGDVTFASPHDLLPAAYDLAAAWLPIAFSYTPGDALLSWLLAHPAAPAVSPTCGPSDLRDAIRDARQPPAAR